MPLTPLRFRPLFKPALWGGTALRPMFGEAFSEQAIGEAWVLSDLDDDPSLVADGPLAGVSLRRLMRDDAIRVLGLDHTADGRFPLLLKFIEARQPLSVQVHPTDEIARRLEGRGAVGKTEAWVVLAADPGARVYAGLEPGATPDALRRAIDRGTVETLVHTYEPVPGDCFFLPAGTVHAIGGGLTLFEVQQASDRTYRLYDWDRVDPRTGRPRDLHVENGLASVDWRNGACDPVRRPAAPAGRTTLVECPYFTLARWEADRPIRVGEADRCRVIVGEAGRGVLRLAGADYRIGPGSVWLLPAVVGTCEYVPDGRARLLECGLPPGG